MSLKKKNIILLSVAFLLLVMTIGYAGLNIRFLISGNIAVEQSYDVSIINISSSASGTAYNKTTPSYTGTTANFDVGFVNPGDKMVYEVTIKNNGSIDARVYDFIVNMNRSALGSGYSFDDVSVILSGVKLGHVLASGESTTMRIEVRQDNNLIINNPSYSFSLEIAYKNNEGQTPSSYPVYYKPNDPVYLIDNSVWRVLGFQSTTSEVTLIKEEPLTSSNTPDLFEGNPTADHTLLETYLQTTYLNSLSANLRSQITSIELPTTKINTDGNWKSNSKYIDDLLYNIYFDCSRQYSSNPRGNIHSCDIGWLGNYSPNYVPNGQTGTEYKTISSSVGSFVSKIENNTGGELPAVYANAFAIDQFNISGFDANSLPYHSIGSIRATSDGVTEHIYCIPYECGGASGTIYTNNLKVYPVITVSVNAIK